MIVKYEIIDLLNVYVFIDNVIYIYVCKSYCNKKI